MAESLIDKYADKLSYPKFLEPFRTGEKRAPNQVSSTLMRAGDRLVPMTHADSMPDGVHAAATSAIGEIDDRQPFDLNEGQRELMARHMIHGTSPTAQELDDYGIPESFTASFGKLGEQDVGGMHLFNPSSMATIGRQGLEDSGFEGWRDNTVSDIRVNAGPYSYAQSDQHQFMPISENNQKYYAHQRAPNMLAALAGEGPPQPSLRDVLLGPPSRETEMKDAADTYGRAKENPRFGYTGMFSGPNYAEAPQASFADNESVIGTMSNALDFGGMVNDYLARQGLDQMPATGDGTGGSLALARDGAEGWARGLASGHLLDAFKYADSLQSARHHGMGMNPQLPGNTYEDRMANREKAESLSQLGEVEDFKTLANERNHGDISRLGEAGLSLMRETFADPGVLTTAYGVASPLLKRGLRAGAGAALGELLSEASGEAVWESPTLAAALMGGVASNEGMSPQEMSDARRYRKAARMEMMNPIHSPWLKK